MKDNSSTLFDEYKCQDLETRIIISFIKNDDSIPASWQIGNFIDYFSSYYYRTELLNSISYALYQGIDPKNIFLLDKSFKVDYPYNDLNDINLTDESIYKLYTIGLPYSMIPNNDIFNINQIFYSCRAISKQLKSRIPKTFITNQIFQVINKNATYKNFLEELKKYAINSIQTKNNPYPSDTYTKINNLIENAEKRFIQYNANEIYFSSINHTLSTNPYDGNLNGNYRDLYNKYYRFFYYFLQIKRPVICIYYKNLNQIKLIGLSHINKNLRGSTFLDLKRMGHNSDFGADFIGSAITSVATLKKTFNEDKRASEMHELDLKEKKVDIAIKLEKLKQEKEKSKEAAIDRTQKEIEVYKKIGELYGQYDIAPPKSPNRYLNIKMLDCYKGIQNGMHNLMEDIGFSIGDIDKSV